ncbi:hypothetical protein ABZ678_02430 [Streptomyces hirsutus]|uniref:Uncharacterized protein n=1 Tax=Streptomyces hirsutus TaxID=35620 RepID=A0ABZ1GSI7_9ACTN|nr:hypothetical protein [Streptomyces hirsutus]WSD08388.1 hypothetical protein OIE73_23420 [Streptomyces hirsutus]WTD18152.1 hypothetical protein OH738_15985 [Streptomyces hirsutus]
MERYRALGFPGVGEVGDRLPVWGEALLAVAALLVVVFTVVRMVRMARRSGRGRRRR